MPRNHGTKANVFSDEKVFGDTAYNNPNTIKPAHQPFAGILLGQNSLDDSFGQPFCIRGFGI
jgi:hypothetical protein